MSKVIKRVPAKWVTEQIGGGVICPGKEPCLKFVLTVERWKCRIRYDLLKDGSPAM